MRVSRIIHFFFLNDPAPPEISPLPLHDALPIYDPAAVHPASRHHAELPGRLAQWRLRPLPRQLRPGGDRRHHDLAARQLDDGVRLRADRKSTRLNSSHSQISYAVFCLKKKKVNA